MLKQGETTEKRQLSEDRDIRSGNEKPTTYFLTLPPAATTTDELLRGLVGSADGEIPLFSGKGWYGRKA